MTPAPDACWGWRSKCTKRLFLAARTAAVTGVGLLSFYTQRSKRKKAYASFDDDADEGVYCVPRGVQCELCVVFYVGEQLMTQCVTICTPSCVRIFDGVCCCRYGVCHVKTARPSVTCLLRQQVTTVAMAAVAVAAVVTMTTSHTATAVPTTDRHRREARRNWTISTTGRTARKAWWMRSSERSRTSLAK